MRIKGIVDEDFVNYKRPSMYICTSVCDFKCEKESGVSCCQNSSLAQEETKVVSDDDIIHRYLLNDITKAIVIGGLEPFQQFEEVFNFVAKLRFNYQRPDTVVIYTGYNKSEVLSMVEAFKLLGNIIIKFGRFVPNQEEHRDDVLGVYLASPNQYAEVIC